MITAAPYGPMWMPEDCTPEQKLPVTWDEQVQAAVDCYNAGATVLHIHVRDPKTGHISKDFKQYNDQLGRLRNAVPKMILQMGGSISFAPEPGEEAKFQSYDSRHKLAEIDPKPDQVTILCGSSLFDNCGSATLCWASLRSDFSPCSLPTYSDSAEAGLCSFTTCWIRSVSGGKDFLASAQASTPSCSTSNTTDRAWARAVPAY
jgi:hypothetical protein